LIGRAVAVDLEALGGLRLIAADGQVVQTQRRRLALLALLAAAGERGLTRDQLVGWLWPEAAEDHAKHALNQLLYGIRRALGEDALHGVDLLRLDPTVIDSDVRRFERALSAGAYGEAVRYYGGPFLEGFYLADAPAFERRVESERARLAAAYADALERLAADAKDGGDAPAAVAWRRRLAELDPLDARRATGLMRALAAAGDSSGALAHGRTYEALVRHELGAPADRAVVELASEIRADSERRPTTAATSAPTIGTAALASPNADVPHSPTRARGEAATPVANATAATARHTRAWGALGLTLSILFVSALAAWVVWSRSRTPRPFTDKVMLAVLPFQNLTGDAAQEYFSDGLTEEMITQLGNRDPERLGVIARTSVMRYKDSQPSLAQIERELGVQYLLEGSVRRDANEVRVAAQLIRVRDQTHVWARQYDRELKGLLTLQGEIAQQIAGEILSTLGDTKPAGSAETVRPTHDYEAYDLYLKGQYFLNRRTIADLERAVAYFRQATTKDPAYARAHAALAHSYALLAGYSARPADQFVVAARASALEAVELDERLPEAHTAVALIVQNHDWDWRTAEREFLQAIELNPNYATAHHWYAEHLMWRGRFDEALRESERARKLDPLSLIIATDHGAILLNSRQYDRAIEQLRSVMELDPDFPRAHIIQAAYVEKGMFAAALADFEAVRPTPTAHWYWAGIAYIYGRSGQTARARHAIQELLQIRERGGVQASIIAGAFAAVGDNEEALAWLERAYAEHDNGLTGLKVNPSWDPLRNDPRFQSLLRRVGLTP